MKEINGILPALVTPYDSNGKIYEQSLVDIIDVNLNKGVDGFYACGSTGEAFLLSTKERKLAASIVVQHVAGRVPVVVHVGSIQTDVAVDLAKHAAEIGADAVSAIPPFYYQFSLEEIKAYYRDIAYATSLPLILYNFPAFSGVSLDQKTAGDLFADGKVIGIKHTSQDLFQLERMKSESPDIIVLNGHDEVFLSALAAGADGAIGSTYNFMADIFIEIRRLYKTGDMDKALHLQRRANTVISVLGEVGVFNGVKHLLSASGISCGTCRRPFIALTPEQKTRLETTAAVLGG